MGFGRLLPLKVRRVCKCLICQESRFWLLSSRNLFISFKASDNAPCKSSFVICTSPAFGVMLPSDDFISNSDFSPYFFGARRFAWEDGLFHWYKLPKFHVKQPVNIPLTALQKKKFCAWECGGFPKTSGRKLSSPHAAQFIRAHARGRVMLKKYPRRAFRRPLSAAA